MADAGFRAHRPDRLLLAPSLLAADFAHLADELARCEAAGVEVLHLDVMDGHFVPNISIGPPVIEALRKVTGMLFDVHLMISHPRDYVGAFAKAGADHITFHIEAESDPAETIAAIRERHCSVGLTLRPGTPAESLCQYLADVDLVLVMSVEPGFGGQSFMADQLPKMRAIRAAADRLNPRLHLEVDGGINRETARQCREAGANVLVAGSSVFRHSAGVAAAVAELS